MRKLGGIANVRRDLRQATRVLNCTRCKNFGADVRIRNAECKPRTNGIGRARDAFRRVETLVDAATIAPSVKV